MTYQANIQSFIRRERRNFKKLLNLSVAEGEKALASFNRRLDKQYDNARYIEDGGARQEMLDQLRQLKQDFIAAKENGNFLYKGVLASKASAVDENIRKRANRALIQQGLPAYY